ncbi:MAG TPA: hypothetical protein VE476_00540 [Propionibacteriaceae bacterium]|jgi:hypothetical protein|nr:hypothetical protein [Propionibacteriaceae bacterium]
MSQSVSSSGSRNAPGLDLDDTGSHTAGGTTEVSWKDNAIGNARGGRVQNVSWGAIFAGVVTFLAIVFLFSLLTAAAGLTGSGAGAAVVSIIGVLIAFFGAGGVAGAMAVRGGLIHGFLTWATAILATVLFVVVLTLGTAGAVGGVLGNVVGGLGSQISQVQPSDIPNPTPEQTRQAEQAAQQAADAAQSGATYGFFGLLLGGVVSSIGGLFGSRSVNSREAVRAGEAARVR